jgi:ribonucleotide monophosphatase NagD (HAD superfamily)
VLGKPAPAFFKLAVRSMACDPADVAMIGDDAEVDVGGTMAAGLQGILVRTGKYQPGQETLLSKPPTLTAKDLREVVDLLFG